MMNKRAISPLIATVMLIAFSIALGAVVMSYGEAYVETKAEFTQGAPEVATNVCDSVDIQLISVKGAPQLCVKSNMVDLSLDNGPGIAIDGLQARVVGSLDVALVQNILKEPVPPVTSLKTMFSHDPVGMPLQVKLTPLLVRDGQTTYCPDKAIVVEDLRGC